MAPCPHPVVLGPPAALCGWSEVVALRSLASPVVEVWWTRHPAHTCVLAIRLGGAMNKSLHSLGFRHFVNGREIVPGQLLVPYDFLTVSISFPYTFHAASILFKFQPYYLKP